MPHALSCLCAQHRTPITQYSHYGRKYRRLAIRQGQVYRIVEGVRPEPRKWHALHARPRRE